MICPMLIKRDQTISMTDLGDIKLLKYFNCGVLNVFIVMKTNKLNLVLILIYQNKNIADKKSK